MTQKRKLGRGLDALLGVTRARKAAEDPIALADTPLKSGVLNDGELTRLPIEWVMPGKYQPRREISQESLQELANSIKTQGVMQPIVVRAIGEQRYEIIAGERRWRATQLAGIDTVPAIVRVVADDAAIAMALIENIQREDLNPIEEAIALQRLKDEFGLTHEQVAEAVGKSRSTVTNLLRLMSLSETVRKMLERGEIEMGHARALLPLSAEKQREAANTIVSKGLSVRQAEALANQMQKPAVTQSQTQPEQKSTDIRRLEIEISEKTGAPTQIQHTAGGKGKLIFKYSSLDELEGILQHIK